MKAKTQNMDWRERLKELHDENPMDDSLGPSDSWKAMPRRTEVLRNRSNRLYQPHRNTVEEFYNVIIEKRPIQECSKQPKTDNVSPAENENASPSTGNPSGSENDEHTRTLCFEDFLRSKDKTNIKITSTPFVRLAKLNQLNGKTKTLNLPRINFEKSPRRNGQNENHNSIISTPRSSKVLLERPNSRIVSQNWREPNDKLIHDKKDLPGSEKQTPLVSSTVNVQENIMIPDEEQEVLSVFAKPADVQVPNKETIPTSLLNNAGHKQLPNQPSNNIMTTQLNNTTNTKRRSKSKPPPADSKTIEYLELLETRYKMLSQQSQDSTASSTRRKLYKKGDSISEDTINPILPLSLAPVTDVFNNISQLRTQVESTNSNYTDINPTDAVGHIQKSYQRAATSALKNMEPVLRTEKIAKLTKRKENITSEAGNEADIDEDEVDSEELSNSQRVPHNEFSPSNGGPMAANQNEFNVDQPNNEKDKEQVSHNADIDPLLSSSHANGQRDEFNTNALVQLSNEIDDDHFSKRCKSRNLNMNDNPTSSLSNNHCVDREQRDSETSDEERHSTVSENEEPNVAAEKSSKKHNPSASNDRCVDEQENKIAEEQYLTKTRGRKQLSKPSASSKKNGTKEADVYRSKDKFGKNKLSQKRQSSASNTDDEVPFEVSKNTRKLPNRPANRDDLEINYVTQCPDEVTENCLPPSASNNHDVDTESDEIEVSALAEPSDKEDGWQSPKQLRKHYTPKSNNGQTTTEQDNNPTSNQPSKRRLPKTQSVNIEQVELETSDDEAYFEVPRNSRRRRNRPVDTHHDHLEINAVSQTSNEVDNAPMSKASRKCQPSSSNIPIVEIEQEDFETSDIEQQTNEVSNETTTTVVNKNKVPKKSKIKRKRFPTEKNFTNERYNPLKQQNNSKLTKTRGRKQLSKPSASSKKNGTKEADVYRSKDKFGKNKLSQKRQSSASNTDDEVPFEVSKNTRKLPNRPANRDDLEINYLTQCPDEVTENCLPPSASNNHDVDTESDEIEVSALAEPSDKEDGWQSPKQLRKHYTPKSNNGQTTTEQDNNPTSNQPSKRRLPKTQSVNIEQVELETSDDEAYFEVPRNSRRRRNRPVDTHHDHLEINAVSQTSNEVDNAPMSKASRKCQPSSSNIPIVEIEQEDFETSDIEQQTNEVSNETTTTEVNEKKVPKKSKIKRKRFPTEKNFTNERYNPLKQQNNKPGIRHSTRTKQLPKLQLEILKQLVPSITKKRKANTVEGVELPKTKKVRHDSIDNIFSILLEKTSTLTEPKSYNFQGAEISKGFESTLLRNLTIHHLPSMKTGPTYGYMTIHPKSIKKACRISLQLHIMVVSGSAELLINDSVAKIETGSLVVMEVGTKYSLRNDSEFPTLIFFNQRLE